jgi:urease accessory protein
MAWLSPAYPTGAFAYSGGIEWAVEAGGIRDSDTLRAWIAALIGHGSIAGDAAFLVHAWRAATAADNDALCAVAELAAAFAPSKERFLETTAQGQAFLAATRAAWPCEALERLERTWSGPLAYPIAVGVAAAGHRIPLQPALTAFLQAVAANLISAGVRLIPLGQSEGLRALASLEGTIAAAGGRAFMTPLDAVGAASFRADIAGMRHETQYTRLFRS